MTQPVLVALLADLQVRGEAQLKFSKEFGGEWREVSEG